MPKSEYVKGFMGCGRDVPRAGHQAPTPPLDVGGGLRQPSAALHSKQVKAKVSANRMGRGGGRVMLLQFLYVYQGCDSTVSTDVWFDVNRLSDWQ